MFRKKKTKNEIENDLSNQLSKIGGPPYMYSGWGTNIVLFLMNLDSGARWKLSRDGPSGNIIAAKGKSGGYIFHYPKDTETLISKF